MDQPNFGTIRANTYTVQALRHRLALTKAFLEDTLYTEKSSRVTMKQLKSYLAEHADQETAEAMQSWGSSFWRGFSKNTLYEKVDALQQRAEQVEHMVLYVPCRLSHEHIVPVGKWVRTHLQSNLMLEVHIDARVVGGCAFVWNGTYYDYSLSRTFQQHRREVVDCLTAYAGDEIH